MNFMNYLLGRASSTAAWIGAIGFVLEILLHLGNVSTLTLVLFVVLIVTPEDKIKAYFGDLTQKIKDADKG